MKFLLSLFSTAALLSVMGTATYAQESTSASAEGKALAIGQQAPEWEELEGVDGKKHSSADVKDAKATVVIFMCNHCPVAQAYEGRVKELVTDYKDKGVEIVAVNVNNIEEDKLPAMRERAESQDFNFVYLYDPSQEIGRAFRATVTPHVFLLDSDWKLAYVGAIDDNMEIDKVEKHYVRDALDAVLAGNKPETDTTKQVGCGILYE